MPIWRPRRWPAGCPAGRRSRSEGPGPPGASIPAAPACGLAWAETCTSSGSAGESSRHGTANPHTSTAPSTSARQGLTRAPAAPWPGRCGGAIRPVFFALGPWPPLPSAAPSARCSCTSIPAPARPPASPASRSTSGGGGVRCSSRGSCRCAQPRPWPASSRLATSAPCRCSEAAAAGARLRPGPSPLGRGPA